LIPFTFSHTSLHVHTLVCVLCSTFCLGLPLPLSCTYCTFWFSLFSPFAFSSFLHTHLFLDLFSFYYHVSWVCTTTSWILHTRSLHTTTGSVHTLHTFRSTYHLLTLCHNWVCYTHPLDYRSFTFVHTTVPTGLRFRCVTVYVSTFRVFVVLFHYVCSYSFYWCRSFSTPFLTTTLRSFVHVHVAQFLTLFRSVHFTVLTFHTFCRSSITLTFVHSGFSLVHHVGSTTDFTTFRSSFYVLLLHTFGLGPHVLTSAPHLVHSAWICSSHAHLHRGFASTCCPPPQFCLGCRTCTSHTVCTCTPHRTYSRGSLHRFSFYFRFTLVRSSLRFFLVLPALHCLGFPALFSGFVTWFLRTRFTFVRFPRSSFPHVRFPFILDSHSFPPGSFRLFVHTFLHLVRSHSSSCHFVFLHYLSLQFTLGSASPAFPHTTLLTCTRSGSAFHLGPLVVWVLPGPAPARSHYPTGFPLTTCTPLGSPGSPHTHHAPHRFPLLHRFTDHYHCACTGFSSHRSTASRFVFTYLLRWFCSLGSLQFAAPPTYSCTPHACLSPRSFFVFLCRTTILDGSFVLPFRSTVRFSGSFLRVHCRLPALSHLYTWDSGFVPAPLCDLHLPGFAFTHRTLSPAWVHCTPSFWVPFCHYSFWFWIGLPPPLLYSGSAWFTWFWVYSPPLRSTGSLSSTTHLLSLHLVFTVFVLYVTFLPFLPSFIVGFSFVWILPFCWISTGFHHRSSFLIFCHTFSRSFVHLLLHVHFRLISVPRSPFHVPFTFILHLRSPPGFSLLCIPFLCHRSPFWVAFCTSRTFVLDFLLVSLVLVLVPTVYVRTAWFSFYVSTVWFYHHLPHLLLRSTP